MEKNDESRFSYNGFQTNFNHYLLLFWLTVLVCLWVTILHWLSPNRFSFIGNSVGIYSSCISCYTSQVWSTVDPYNTLGDIGNHGISSSMEWKKLAIKLQSSELYSMNIRYCRWYIVYQMIRVCSNMWYSMLQHNWITKFKL